jgi:hypothetical protein
MPRTGDFLELFAHLESGLCVENHKTEPAEKTTANPITNITGYAPESEHQASLKLFSLYAEGLPTAAEKLLTDTLKNEGKIRNSARNLTDRIKALSYLWMDLLNIILVALVILEVCDENKI